MILKIRVPKIGTDFGAEIGHGYIFELIPIIRIVM